MAAPAIPSVTFNFPNTGLGSTPQSPGGIFAVVGSCTHPGMALATPTTISGSPANVVSVAGYGPAADLMANLVQGGATVVGVAAASTGATPSAVTHTGTGTSVMTVTGTGFDQYFVLVTVVDSDVALTGQPTITISLDNGQSTSGKIVVPLSGTVANIAATTGLTLHFAAGTLVSGEAYAFTVAAPTVLASDVVTAVNSLITFGEPFSMVYVVGAFSATDTATINSAVATLPPKKKFVRMWSETVDGHGTAEATWMTALKTDFVGTLQSDLSVVSAGNDFVLSVVLNAYMWRSIGQPAAVRATQVAISRDLGVPLDGPLVPYANANPVAKPKAQYIPTGYFIHDESQVPGLNLAQFMTQSSIVGLTGYFVTNPNIMSGPTSSYSLLQLGRVSDEIARLTNIYFTQQLSNDVLLDPSTGKMSAKAIAQLQSGNNAACASVVNAQHVSALATVVDGNANILNFEPIQVTVRYVPKGYTKAFVVNVLVARTISG